MADRLPLVVYVSGAPGTGKTTLAAKIAEELYIPHVSSDKVHGGARYTEGRPNDRKQTLQETFAPLLVEMAKSQISFVVDHVLQHNMSEADILDKLIPYARLVYIHLHAKDAIERHLQRELARKDRGVIMNPDQLMERSEFHRENLKNTSTPLTVALPMLEVEASSGYLPSFENILSFIEENYERPGNTSS
jgi:gluconate kinase